MVSRLFSQDVVSVNKVAWVSERLFSEFHRLMPILCLDLVVCHGPAVLLLKRDVAPLKGCWFLPGGRVRKRESFSDAIARLASTEVGLNVHLPGVQLGVEQTMFEEDPFNHGEGTHTVNVVYAVESKGKNVALDGYHSSYKWINIREDISDLHPYVVRQIGKAREEIAL